MNMQSMGIGQLGQPGTIIKRKFRFTLEWETPVGIVPIHFVKVAQRPSLEMGEVELNFLNAVTWIPGKGRFQPLSVTYIDVAHEEMKPLYDWISQVYGFQLYGENGDNLTQSEKAGWAAEGILKIFDGCGKELERWTLYDCWPQSINFGELGYEDSEVCNIDLTVRYSRAKLEGINCMPTPEGDCVGCE